MCPEVNTLHRPLYGLPTAGKTPLSPKISKTFPKPLDKLYCVWYSIVRKGVCIMDIQLKRGLLEVCVLAAIKSEDSYGYKIIKDIGPCIDISESTLYPILRRLEAAELLTVYSVEHNGRLRKYYRITNAGRARLDTFRTEWREIMTIYEFVCKEDPS